MVVWVGGDEDADHGPLQHRSVVESSSGATMVDASHGDRSRPVISNYDNVNIRNYESAANSGADFAPPRVGSAKGKFSFRLSF